MFSGGPIQETDDSTILNGLANFDQLLNDPTTYFTVGVRRQIPQITQGISSRSLPGSLAERRRLKAFIPCNEAVRRHSYDSKIKPNMGLGFIRRVSSLSGLEDQPNKQKRSKQSLSTKKGAWSLKEDNLLRSLVQQNLGQKWSLIACNVPGRTPKQCRERWSCNLDPRINRGVWTIEEDRYILQLQRDIGNRWAQISTYLNGRTENAVKTRYKSIKRAKKRAWSETEDNLVLKLHKEHGPDWDIIAKQFSNRTKNAVKTRHRLLIKGELMKPPQPGAPEQVIFEDRFYSNTNHFRQNQFSFPEAYFQIQQPIYQTVEIEEKQDVFVEEPDLFLPDISSSLNNTFKTENFENLSGLQEELC